MTDLRSVLWLSVFAVFLSLSVSAQEATDSSVESQSQSTANDKNEAAASSSSIQLKTTSVTGSRELPKVLVIVPWKTSEALGPGERPLASLVEEALTPVDPDVFRRQLDYYSKLKDTSASNGKGKTTK
ncbi:MAG: hypothetical protein AB8G18_09420 [Gammaproteobacteria bacterium]